MATQSIAPPSSQHTRAVLLDFDGTLGASLPAWTGAFDDVLRGHGVTVPQETVIKYCFHSCPDEVIRSHGITDGEGFKRLVWANVTERMSEVAPYPHARETLLALRERGFKIAVVTNSRRATVQPVLSRWQLDHLFDAVLTIEDVSHGKPDPEMIHRALNMLNISPSHACIIGDSKSDVIAGKRAGIKTIAFSPEDNWKYLAIEALRFTEPSHLVHSFGELWEVLGLHNSEC
jgi:pyrophosphatase PpaX